MWAPTLVAVSTAAPVQVHLAEHLERNASFGTKYKIDFVSPKKGTMTAVLEIDHQTIEQLRDQAQDNQSTYLSFTLVIDEDGQVVAILKKTLYVRKKREGRESVWLSQPKQPT